MNKIFPNDDCVFMYDCDDLVFSDDEKIYKNDCDRVLHILDLNILKSSLLKCTFNVSNLEP